MDSSPFCFLLVVKLLHQEEQWRRRASRVSEGESAGIMCRIASWTGVCNINSSVLGRLAGVWLWAGIGYRV